MKLHLPLSLLAAFMLTCLGTNASADTTVGTNTYSGDIYTWVGTAATFHNGGIIKSSYSEGSYTYSDYTASWNSGTLTTQGLFGSSGLTTYNTLRFVASDTTLTNSTASYTVSSTNTSPSCEFDSPYIGGLIVESGATGYAFNSDATSGSSKRTLYVGKSSGTDVLFTINEDFSIGGSSSGKWTSVVFQDTTNIGIANNKTLTFNAAAASISANKGVTISGLTDGAAGTVAFSGDLTLNTGSTLAIDGNSTVTVGGTLYYYGSHTGAIDLGSSGLLQLTKAPGAYYDGQEFTVGTLTYGNRNFSDIIANLGSRQEANYANGLVTITSTAAELTWNGADMSYWTVSTNWLDSAGETDGLQWGDSIILSSATADRSLYVNQDLQLDTVTVQGNHTVDVHGGATMSAKFITDGDNVTLSKRGDATLELQAGSNVRELVVGKNFRGDLGGGGTVKIKDDAEIGTLEVAAGTVNLESGSNVNSASISAGALNITAGSTVSDVKITGGTTTLGNGNQTTVGDISVSSGGVLQVAGSNHTVQHNGTITIKDADGATVATYTARENGASYTSVYFGNQAAGSSYDAFQYITPYSGTAIISKADIQISGNYSLRNTIDLRESSFTIGTNVEVSTLSHNGSSVTASFGNLVVNAGAMIVKHDALGTGSNVSYYGAIDLTLGSATFTAPDEIALAAEETYTSGYSTNALFGAMQAGSTMTLSFGDIDIAEGTDMIAFTLTGLNSTALTSATGYDLLTNTYTVGDDVSSIFTVSGWNVDSITYGENTVLNLSRAAADPVPEPTTATLSLLALAGLAARRRRK